MSDTVDNRTKYYDLLKTQRRLNEVVEAQVKDCDDDLKRSKALLAHEVEKLVRLDADPAVFNALVRAAEQTPESKNFAALARETEAKVRLKSLISRFGPPKMFRENLLKEEGDLEEKERRRDSLKERIEKLSKQLEPVYLHNRQYSSIEINEYNRKKIEDRNWGGIFSDKKVNEAYGMVSAYNKKNGKRRDDGSFTPANCFSDLKEYEEAQGELKGLIPDIDHRYDRYYQNLAAYGDVRDIEKILPEEDLDYGITVDLDSFQTALSQCLNDDEFITSFAKNTASGVGGKVILAALNTRIRQKTRDNLFDYLEKVREMTKHWEGPVGIIARDSGIARPLDKIDADMKSQALMGGYLCESAAAAFRAVTSFSPDHTEGPVSLTRDLHMHMIINGNVDPAYIHEVFEMDRMLVKHFKVNRTRPEPDFKKVLSNPNSVERIHRQFAGFLKENAEDQDIKDAGFAAGQFNTASIEALLGRYISVDTTREKLFQIVEEEAERVQTELAKMKNIRGEDSPGLPEL